MGSNFRAGRGTLTAPTGLTAVHDETAGTVALSWTAPDPSTGLVNYRVLRCGDWPSEANCTGILTGSTATTYTDTAVSGTRWYGVTAVNAVGDSYRACLRSIWQDEYRYKDSVPLRKVTVKQHNSVCGSTHNPNVVIVLDF